jgi:hypothetical protein
MVIVIQLPQNIIGYISNERFLAVVIHLLLRNAYKKSRQLPTWRKKYSHLWLSITVMYDMTVMYYMIGI